MPPLNHIPDEIIRQILGYVSPDDNIASIQILSKRFNHLANEPLLWRYHCRTSFKYWCPRHYFQMKLEIRASEVPWKEMWLTRRKRNAQIAYLFDRVLSSKVGRMMKFAKICSFRYDAKDFLLEQCHADDSAEDVLARRYYANSMLDSIHRSEAVEVWSRYHSEEHNLFPHMELEDTCSNEQALGAFDMFVLHDQPQDLNYIKEELNALAGDFQREHSTCMSMPTRQRALTLVRWLREKNFRGIQNETVNYRNIRNCLIGHALSNPEHPSLPLVSSTIFCAVANRLEIEAWTCAIPGHVHACVSAPLDQTLDGASKEWAQGRGTEKMILDPYGSDHEIAAEDVRRRLPPGVLNGLDTNDFMYDRTPPSACISRMAMNIQASIDAAEDLAPQDPQYLEIRKLRTGHPDLNMEAMRYAKQWADLLASTGTLRWERKLDLFLNSFALNWSEDSWIVENYVVPLYDELAHLQPAFQMRGGWQDPHTVLGMLHNLDNRQPTLHRRYTKELEEKVQFKIGQVVRHKRYHYIGIINGWAAMGPENLPIPHDMTEGETENDGREHKMTFYTCLRSSVDRLRVAQENIEIITDASLIPDSLFYLAGKFFKRFDRETCQFVSNMKELYPDD